MKQLFDPLFIAYCLAWCVIHLFRYAGQPLPLLNGHLTDFLAVPAMAHVAVTFTRRWIVRDRSYTYPLSYLLFIALYVSVVSEWIMPNYSTKYTRDGWDVVAYFAGSIFYYYCHGSIGGHNKPANNIHPPTLS